MENYYELDEQKLKSITEEIVQILIKKNQDYGGASFDLGLHGNVVHLWDKVKRYKTLIEKKMAQSEEPNFESIQDTLKDIIGYALIGLLMLDSSNNETVSDQTGN